MQDKKIRLVDTLPSLPSLPKLHKNLGVYCRVSSNNHEQLSSLAQQVSHYVQMFRPPCHYLLYDIYIDVCSGSRSDQRTQYQRMLKDCKEKKLDTIITKSISRFGRDTAETLTAIRELKACDVNFIFESENIDTLAVDSEVLITIISAYAQAENDSRSDNVTWGIKKRAADGTSGLYRRRCYGYTNDESGELAIVPDEAEVVRLIFESYLNGASLMKIRTSLEERGALSPTGKSKWCNRTIDMMLSNEKYCGEVILIKTISDNSVMKKRIANTGQRESCKMIESHPPIISRDEFDRVQAEKAKRQRNKTSKVE